MSRDLIFHLLDLQARDQRVENETEDAREVVYESADEESDEEMGYGHKRPVAKKTDYNANREYVIHLFGSTSEGKPVRVDVTGFRPYFYLRLPEVDTGKAIEAIRYYMTTQGIPMAKIGFKRVMSKQFYGFTAGKLFPFLQIDMPSLSLFRTVQKLFLDEKSNPQTKRPLDPPLRGKQVEVYESNIDPMLRFLHVQNIQPCGWVKIPGGMTYIDDVNAEQWAFECNYEDILPAVGPKAVAPFLLASWDIECYSSTGDFPLAKRGWTKFAKDSVNECNSAAVVAGRLIEYLNKVPCGLKKSMDAIKEFVYSSKVQDKINTIITAYADDDAIKELTKYLEKEMKNFVSLKGDPVIQIGITLTRGGDLDRHLFVFPDCDPIPGITVHAYKDEKTMINRFFAWIVDQNPDILVGYNVFGFDEKYLWERAEELGCIGSDSPVHELTRLFELGSEVKCEEKFLSSSALGDNVMHIWSTHGRLQIDLYHYIRRTAVLPSYKLDEVTKHYMSGKLKKFRQEGGRLYLDVAGAIQDVRPGRAVCLLDETGEGITEKLVVLEVNGGTIVTAAVEDDVDLEDARKWVIVKDDVGPQDIFRLHRGSSADRAIVGKYCLQDCDLVLELYKKLEVFNNTMSMANVCTVPIGYIFTRGQGIKIESLIFKACREHNTLIPVLPAPKQKGEAEDSYEGAIVLDPVPGFYSQSPIGVADFASLYPSSIESENLSHDSIVWVRDYDYNGNLIANVFGSDEYAECEGYGYTDIDFDLWRPDPADKRKHPVKVKSGRRVCRYAQPLDGSKSTLPEIIRQLLAARKAKRKEAEKEESAERKALLDAEQLAYKLTANSLYGQLGSGTFKIRMQHLAASTTAYGRKQILFAKAVIERFYGPGADPRCAAKCEAKVVYGDSVTGDTPLVLKKNGVVFIRRFDELYNDDVWNTYHDTKESIDVSGDGIWVWTENGFTRIRRVIRHKLAPNKKLYRINTHTGVVDVTEDHSLVLATGVEAKPSDVAVGTELLHNDEFYKQFNGAYNDIENMLYNTNTITDIPTKQIAAEYYIGARQLGYSVQVEDMADGTFTLICDKNGGSASNAIKKIRELAHPGDAYVYDLETDNHHFAVGPGALVVHNTDSLFVEFNPRNPETGERLTGREARQATIDLTAEAGKLVTKALAPPHDFEFDKIFDPMLMFSKKRYAGNMYEENADDFVHKYMGIALKRRDNAPIVKTIFGGAMKKLLLEKDVIGATKFVKESCMELVNGNVSLNQLTITKSLRADYADPTRIAHKALADRMAERDPGNAPSAGDRIGYIYIKPDAGQQSSKLQGDRIEHPSYVREKGLSPDYRFYVEHQIQNPVSQMFGLLLEQMPGFNPAVLRSAPEDPEKRLAWAEDQAAQILFNECLQRCSTTDKKAFITKFFGSPATVVDMKVKKVAGSGGEGNTVITVSSGVKKAAQGSIDNYMFDKFLLKGLKDKEKKDAKAAAAKAAEEEEKGGSASPPPKRRRIAKDE